MWKVKLKRTVKQTAIRTAKRTAIAAAVVTIITAAVTYLIWSIRPNVDSIAWTQPAVASAASANSVTVTWLGVTTLLFDDGDTQILIDGFFTRPSIADVLFNRAIDNHAAVINYALSEFRMRRLAAVIPVHSHFDHAMDVGAIANRSSASILGSSSTAQIARGAGVPEDQIIVANTGQDYVFGEFVVSLRRSAHAPIGWRGSVPFDGQIDAPLEMPRPASAFRVGDTYSVVVAHPKGTAIVKGSAGCIEGELQDVQADVVMLGVAQLTSVGKTYAEACWRNAVTNTGAHSVYTLHFDDYTKPFGVIEPWPTILGDFTTIVDWLEEFRDRWDTDTTLFIPQFGRPIAIYSESTVAS